VSAHTPTPWKVFTTPDGLKLVGIGSEDGGGICDAGFGVWSWKDAEGIANANLIVRAVNSHANMLAALHAAVNWYTPPNDSGPFPLKQIVDAITKAEGKS
jgi:hypothetical protein